jgi:glycosyltransferase involved in cell wall biosynthesis
MRVPLINGSIRNCFRSASTRWKVERALLALSDFRIANSTAGLHSRGFSPNSPKDFVIHNGFDLSRAEIADSAGSDGIAHDQVGMIAEFRPDKDFKTFLLAARRLVSQRPNVIFVTVGDGETLEEMKQLAGDAGDRIQFLGRRKNVEQIISSFSVGVLSTFTEGISNSIMEYMVMAKPVIASDCAGSREIVLEGKTGFLVPPQDSEALADRISFLLDHPDEARRMGKAGRKHIEENFSLKAMVDQTIEIYERSMQSQNRRGIAREPARSHLRNA